MGNAAIREREELWESRAAEQLQSAQEGLADPSATSDDILSAMGLAMLAFRIAVGDTTPESWPEDDPEPECICPPELVAGGGFKGDCPARGYAHG